ncbi:MAG: hypothetical protein ACOYMA_18505 [Bacteroidia bacterium]
MTELTIKIFYFFKIKYEYDANDLIFMSHKSTKNLSTLYELFLVFSISPIFVYKEKALLICLIILPPVFILMFKLFKQYFFKVLLIYADKLMIIFPYNSDKSITIHFAEISKIKYYPGYKNSPNNISVYLLKPKNNKISYTILVGENIYKFANTLKFLKEKGIQIEFHENDAEIQGFVNGQFDKIPLTNKY